MLNNIMLVGRIATINKNEKSIILKVQRKYKNNDGIYEYDNIKIFLNDEFFNQLNEYCKINDLIGIKGYIETLNNEIIIKSEKITYLTSK